jgi:transcriptional regulator with XRE-family HTH domain
MSKRQAVSEQLRNAIGAAGVTRYRICRDLGISESTLSRFMAGTSGLTLATIDRLAEYLHLELVSRKPRKE